MRKTPWVPAFVATVCLATASLAAQATNTQQPPASPAPSTSAPSAPTDPSAPTETQAAPSAPAPRAPAAQAAAGKKITLSGCVERQPETAPFMLTRAAAVAASAPVGTSGAASAPASVAKTYRLDAAETMIAPHVGHKVEVTGTVDDQPSPAASAGAAAEGAGAASAANAPKLKIESVKMVAATCQ